MSEKASRLKFQRSKLEDSRYIDSRHAFLGVWNSNFLEMRDGQSCISWGQMKSHSKWNGKLEWGRVRPCLFTLRNVHVPGLWNQGVPPYITDCSNFQRIVECCVIQVIVIDERHWAVIRECNNAFEQSKVPIHLTSSALCLVRPLFSISEYKTNVLQSVMVNLPASPRQQSKIIWFPEIQRIYSAYLF